MSFVLRAPDAVGGPVYKKGKYGTTPDLQKARVFTRRCDASNARWIGRKDLGVTEVVEVKLVEVAQT